MFLDEARVAARIRHPNVIPTLDIVAAEGELLLIMEYVQGESLSRLNRASLQAAVDTPLPVISAIVAGALHGLHAAHEASGENGEPLHIVHRDVSPQNILVGEDGVVRVLDFGIASAVGRLQVTRDGQIKGKLAYMPPEQFWGKPLDRRADVYAMAVVLWECITQRRLFKTSCARWGSELATEVPTLRIELPGEASGVVVLDGVPAGAAPAELRLNPGVHRLFARTADGDGPETRVELSPGQQLTVTLKPPRPAPIASAAPPPAASAAPAGGGSKVAPLVLLGVGGVALGVGAWLGVSSWREARTLREDCAPACEASRVDTLRGRLRTADVLLGLGAVAGGVGLYLWLRKDTAVTVAPQTGGAAISTALRF
jgi:serine/threonine-protein kinase